MFMDILMLFIVLSILFFILSIYLMEENPFLSIPFIMLGMIFTILVTYGMWNVEVLYVNYNASSGLTNTSIYTTMSYGDPYSYIFMLFFFMFMVLFFRAGFNMWKEALKTQAEMNYRTHDKRWR
jgi:hypothetical protein